MEKRVCLLPTHVQDHHRGALGHGLEPKVLRIVGGDNPGITELVLREYQGERADS